LTRSPLIRSRRLRPVLAAAVAAALLPAGASPVSAAERVRPLRDSSPLGNERLSNERTLTRWAHAVHRSPIRRKPARGSRRVGRIRLLTEDGYPEVYLALRSRRNARRQAWVQVRIPARPNGQTGWVPQSALGVLDAVRTALTIDRLGSVATLRRAGRRIWRAPVGHGAPGTPTPPGRFYIRERIRNLTGDPLYGPWAFGTSAYSGLSDWPGGGVIGIHGTNQPGLIPGRPSHGCVRVRNPDIQRLARLMPIGTPVRIR
jgi:lipoprotein-anchoring transpeptidase ErfK/SrfK